MYVINECLQSVYFTSGFSAVGLFHIEHESFQIFTFGMGEVDRMVGGLGELVENPDPASALGGGAEDGEAEHFAGDRLRAGEGEDNSTRFDFLKRLCIELSVTDESVLMALRCLAKAGGSRMMRS